MSGRRAKKSRKPAQAETPTDLIKTKVAARILSCRPAQMIANSRRVPGYPRPYRPGLRGYLWSEAEVRAHLAASRL